ncbi:hypothetical protein A2276_02420 [candidate division WOR-1 bacterium RIFOXYA12_FULL_43_27]|uniref:Uncharacterized protein n=1 Tax=candidate division WOR-1 bacterium RIFOXYC2_FULL_46_14 TaxID=1802587 RepID=A0A1F4U9Q5_UNCSA|nr:MAG: hypothetical protein A2276_02420 [candidate division WOR-1 bacterium RIFOXYA12_FULL_43_27]OGC19434.1 MAG: hypothetical protein A2292_01910 [candidate division WOR-1 bacterium RIFOXYB2_FULL_46_45]OGC30423.1 MAG: hypothetical protein A2232_01910 [candidate division WOR-1 bacterium RIFOXYA2_FULL_46_56]OGC41023.1 MAG: hypothetical protein A2438_01910 [candidate division WOR-1 bacterium RIFOXYC2_FULL_46_14]
MKFDIDEKHFNVFNLLLLLLAWANTCYILVIFTKNFVPLLLTTILVLTGTALTLAMVVITIITTVRWVKHHNWGWWLLIALVVLCVLSWSLESTMRGLLIREQVYNYQQGS